MPINKTKYCSVVSQRRFKKQHLALLVTAIAVMIVGISSLSNSFETSSTKQYTPTISKETAANIAANYLGASPSQVNQIELDNENGIHMYSVEIIKDNLENDVKVDPQTGEVKGVEQGPIEVSDGDGETDDDANDETETNDGKSVSDGDGETNDDATD